LEPYPLAVPLRVAAAALEVRDPVGQEQPRPKVRARSRGPRVGRAGLNRP